MCLVQQCLFLLYKPRLQKLLLLSTDHSLYPTFLEVRQAIKVGVTLTVGPLFQESTWSSQRPLKLQIFLCFSSAVCHIA